MAKWKPERYKYLYQLWDKKELGAAKSCLPESTHELDRSAVFVRIVGAAELGNPLVRRCTVVTVDVTAYTATVEFGGAFYAGIAIAHQVRAEDLQSGDVCLVAFNSFDAPQDSVIFVTYSGPPAPDSRFDGVVGHKHSGRGKDGAQVSHNDLVDV